MPLPRPHGHARRRVSAPLLGLFLGLGIGLIIAIASLGVLSWQGGAISGLPALWANSRSQPQQQRHVFGRTIEISRSFPQPGSVERGEHWRLDNADLIPEENKVADTSDSVLLLTIAKDATSWGNNRSAVDFFQLVANFTYPTTHISLAILVSERAEFETVRNLGRTWIHAFTRISVLFRNDFGKDAMPREARHAANSQGSRRRMLARYRNFALQSTLEPWHEHVLWIDSDVHIIPGYLLTKMIRAKRDILEPLCYVGVPPSVIEYDLNAWAGTRKKRPENATANDFVPGPDKAKYIRDFRGGRSDYISLDSVGGTMLYVRADIHRQGVLFPHHYIIGSEWEREGYDGIETEGVCYAARFLGFQCWGMPHDVIYHASN